LLYRQPLDKYLPHLAAALILKALIIKRNVIEA